MYAVEFPRTGRIIFSLVPVPAEFREEIRGDLGGVVRDGLTLDVPDGVFDWPEGQRAPEAVLCVSAADPSAFRVFKFADEVDRDAYRPTGLSWGTIPSASGWGRFMESIRNLNRIARQSGGVEPPDDDEEAAALTAAQRAG